MRRIITFFVVLSAVTTVAACETTKGFVRDAQNVGDALIGN